MRAAMNIALSWTYVLFVASGGGGGVGVSYGVCCSLCRSAPSQHQTLFMIYLHSVPCLPPICTDRATPGTFVQSYFCFPFEIAPATPRHAPPRPPALSQWQHAFCSFRPSPPPLPTTCTPLLLLMLLNVCVSFFLLFFHYWPYLFVVCPTGSLSPLRPWLDDPQPGSHRSAPPTAPPFPALSLCRTERGVRVKVAINRRFVVVPPISTTRPPPRPPARPRAPPQTETAAR